MEACWLICHISYTWQITEALVLQRALLQAIHVLREHTAGLTEGTSANFVRDILSIATVKFLVVAVQVCHCDVVLISCHRTGSKMLYFLRGHRQQFMNLLIKTYQKTLILKGRSFQRGVLQRLIVGTACPIFF